MSQSKMRKRKSSRDFLNILFFTDNVRIKEALWGKRETLNTHVWTGLVLNVQKYDHNKIRF